MKRHLITIVILAIFTAGCLMLVACSKQDDQQITNPTTPIDVTTMTPGQIHNVTLEFMLNDKSGGTIEERGLRALYHLYPQANAQEIEVFKMLFVEKNLNQYLTAQQWSILEQLRLASTDLQYGDYRNLENMYDQVYSKHGGADKTANDVLDMHRASFDFWSTWLMTDAGKRTGMEVGSLCTMADTGGALLGIGATRVFGVPIVIGPIFGAVCSIALAEYIGDCMGGCVAAPYYGPNPWCC